MKRFRTVTLAAVLLTGAAHSQDAPGEAHYYPLQTVDIPDGIVLEVGGLLPRDDGSLLVCTRRGDIWHVADPWGEAPQWTLWCDGLQEPLGLLADGDAVLCGQRGELTRIRDTDGDGHADSFEVIADDWDISGNYHEYCFGPRRDAEGNLWLTLNRPFGEEWFGKVDWRTFALRIRPDGTVEKVAAGLRSPAGVEVAPWGDVFYTDNQGEWCGASKLSQIVPGSFHGHPMRVDDTELPGSMVERPAEIIDGILFPEAAKRVPSLQLPAVWFPYDKTGRSPSGMAWDRSDGGFGPFAGQLFVGDQYGANVLRVFLEQVDGHWQGACFRFREGLASGVIRVGFDDAGLVVGSSDRGWPSLGKDSFGLERLTWSGETPFEILEMRATPDGFLLKTTQAVDVDTLVPDSFALESYTYEWHSTYGSDEMDKQQLRIVSVEAVAGSGMTAFVLRVEGLREGYVHELTSAGLRAAGSGYPLLHPRAWYTLIKRPVDGGGSEGAGR